MYIIIQSCIGYEKSLNNILPQLSNLQQEDIIVVLNKSQENNIYTKNNIFIETKNNNFELTSFAEIYKNINIFDKYDKFLFLHDTIDLGPSFLEKLSYVKNNLNYYNFDWAPLSANFQSMFGIATKNFIIEKFKVFDLLSPISKQDAIDMEWGTGRFGVYSIRNICKKPLILGPKPVTVSEDVSFLNSDKKRVKIYFESLDIYKYYFVHSNNTPHPNSL